MNNVSVIGRTTKDIELKYTQNDRAVCDFTIAIDRNYTTAKGEKKEDVVFMPVRCWSKTAENVSRYVKKGHRIAVSGSLKQDRWEDSDGKKRSKIYVLAAEVQFLETKKQESQNGYKSDSDWEE